MDTNINIYIYIYIYIYKKLISKKITSIFQTTLPHTKNISRHTFTYTQRKNKCKWNPKPLQHTHTHRDTETHTHTHTHTMKKCIKYQKLNQISKANEGKAD